MNKVKLQVRQRNNNNSNSVESHIESLTTGNVASYYRSKGKFSYSLSYELSDKQYFSVIHYFNNSSKNETENGETIVITYFGDKTQQEIDMRYNITKGTIGTYGGKKRPITPDEKEYIYDQLVRAISLASEITINNMKKQENVKQLKIDAK